MLFLAHCAADKVTPAERIPRKVADNLHYLLLIDHAAVGCVQNRPQKLRFVFHRSGILFALNVARNLIHRTRAIERNAGDNVLKACGLHLHHEMRHPARLKLKNSDGVARTYKVIYAFVVVIAVVKVRRRSPGPLYVFAAITNHGQRPKPEKIHLQHSELFKLRHCELRRDSLIIALKRNKLHRRKG